MELDGKNGDKKCKRTILKVLVGKLWNTWLEWNCSRPSGPKPEMQHDRRGRGVTTLTWEEVTIREGKDHVVVDPKRKLWDLEMILTGSQLTGQERCVSCRILHDPMCGVKVSMLMPRKDPTFCTRFNVQDVSWTGSILGSSPYDLMDWH